MKISEIKKKMMVFEDFYGADIFAKDDIKKAKTKKELDQVLSDYARHMEDREIEAMAHFDTFRNGLGLWS